MPIGTGNPDTLRDSNKRQERRACASCPQFEKCMFNLPRMGSLKGNERYETRGRHNVAFGLVTDGTEGRNAIAGFMSCETFVEVFQDRMVTGRELRDRGLDGEVIRIIGHEGDTIASTLRVGFNGRGEIVHAQPHLVEAFRRAGHTVNVDDRNPPVRWDDVTFEQVVPKYKAPNAHKTAYSNSIAQKMAKMEEMEDDAEAQVWEASRKRVVAEPESGEAPISEPVKRGPGRPAKVRDET